MTHTNRLKYKQDPTSSSSKYELFQKRNIKTLLAEMSKSTKLYFTSNVYNGSITINKINSNQPIKIEGQEILIKDANSITTLSHTLFINGQNSPNHNLRNKKYFIRYLFLIYLILFFFCAIFLVCAFNFNSKEVIDEQETVINSNSSSSCNSSIEEVPHYNRVDWLAQKRKKFELFKIKPLHLVIISHTVTEECFNKTQCCSQVWNIQQYHLETRQWDDIAYNFLIGGDGGIYEGRGWDIIGSHAHIYNNRSIGISLIGNFVDKLPTEKQITALKLLIEEGVRLNKISTDYKLLGHCQVSKTESPGKKLYEELIKWPQWSSNV